MVAGRVVLGVVVMVVVVMVVVAKVGGGRGRSGRVRGGRSSCVVSSVGGVWELTRLVWPAQAPADSFY